MPVFVYVTQPGDINPSTGEPRQELRLAELTSIARARARDLAVLGDNLGDGSPENFSQLAASPFNLRAVAYSIQLPIGAIDHDLQVYDLATGEQGLFFNEHTLASIIGRPPCHSPDFDAFLASEMAAGVPAAALAGYNFQIQVEGADSANVPEIETIARVDDEILYLRWPFRVRVTGTGADVQWQETFELQLNVAGGMPALAACIAPSAMQSPPGPIVALSPGGSGPQGLITVDGRNVLFPAPPPKLSQVQTLQPQRPPSFPTGPGSPTVRLETRTALMAAGTITRTR